MPLTNLNIGAAPNDGTGETLRSGGAKINTNYTFTVTTDTTQTITGAKTFTANVTASTITNSTSALTLQTTAGNNNVVLSPHGTGIVRTTKSLTIDSTGVQAGLRINVDQGTAGLFTHLVQFFNTTTEVARIVTRSVGTGKDAGTLEFFTNNSGTITERMRIAADGTVQLPSGSPGIKFGTRNANLADYEEGTWTPGLVRLGGGLTFTASTGNGGRYVKVGRVVHFWARLFGTATGTLTGSQNVTGLPFTVETALGIGGNAQSAIVALGPTPTTLPNQFFEVFFNGTVLRVGTNPASTGSVDLYISGSYVSSS